MNHSDKPRVSTPFPRGYLGEKSHLFNFTGVSANKAGMGADRKLVADFVYQKSFLANFGVRFLSRTWCQKKREGGKSGGKLQ